MIWIYIFHLEWYCPVLFSHSVIWCVKWFTNIVNSFFCIWNNPCFVQHIYPNTRSIISPKDHVLLSIFSTVYHWYNLQKFVTFDLLPMNAYQFLDCDVPRKERDLHRFMYNDLSILTWIRPSFWLFHFLHLL